MRHRKPVALAASIGVMEFVNIPFPASMIIGLSIMWVILITTLHE